MQCWPESTNYQYIDLIKVEVNIDIHMSVLYKLHLACTSKQSDQYNRVFSGVTKFHYRSDVYFSSQSKNFYANYGKIGC